MLAGQLRYDETMKMLLTDEPIRARGGVAGKYRAFKFAQGTTKVSLRVKTGHTRGKARWLSMPPSGHSWRDLRALHKGRSRISRNDQELL